MSFTLGIDIGSTTVKIAILDENKNILFSNYKIHRIEARVAPDNIPSIKLLERLHFRFEGIEYQSVEVNGRYTDHYRYSLLAPDDLQ